MGLQVVNQEQPFGQALALLAGIDQCDPAEVERRLGRVVDIPLSDGEIETWYAHAKSKTGWRLPVIRKIVDGKRPKANGADDAAGYFDKLVFSDRGVPYANEYNVSVVLRHDPALAGVIAYNVFAFSAWMKNPGPWVKTDDAGDRQWTDRDDIALATYVQSIAGVNASVDTVRKAVELVAGDKEFHPVRDYLDGLTWDGTNRISTWLTDYLGAADTAFTRAVARAFLVSAVARVYSPGCKVDTILILEGRQGLRKSTAARTLFGDDFYTDEIDDLGSKDAKMQVAGVWGIEMAELESMSKSEANRAKAFISRGTDRFRAPYGARLMEAPRQSVFVGTSNDTHYLQDSTGGRRYWPVKCAPVRDGQLDTAGLAAARDQIWAEAVAAYRAGEIWWLEDEDVIAEATEEQEERYAEDPWEPIVGAWLYATDHSDLPVIPTDRILRGALSLREGEMTTQTGRRLAKVMTRLGYKSGKGRIEGQQVRGYKLDTVE